MVGTQKMVSMSFLVSRWAKYNLQVPAILTVSFVYVPIWSLFGISFSMFGSLNTILYTDAGIMLSAQVSSLAHKYKFLFSCIFNLYWRFVIKHVSFLSTLVCACTWLTCSWRQNELSKPSESDWLSYACIVPAVSWCAFGFQFLL